MTLSAATLESELMAMVLYDNAPDAAAAWALAYTNYFKEAQTSTTSVPVVQAALTTPQAAMEAALQTISPGAGASVLATAIQAFWAPIMLAPTTYFPGMIIPAVLPTGLATLAATLQATFDDNIAAKKSKTECVALVAADIHTASAGATVTFPGPPPVVEVIL